jgi:hypothetical protein
MTARTRTELSALSEGELLVIRAGLDSKDPVAYAEALAADQVLQAWGAIPTPAEEQARRDRRKIQEARTRRLDETLAPLNASGVSLPLDWITSGAWGSLPCAALRVAPVVASLLKEPGQHLRIDLIAEVAHISYDTAKRGVRACEAAGLLKIERKKLRDNNLVRTSAFFTLISGVQK